VRNFIDIVESVSKFIFPSPEEVFPDSEVENIANKGFDVGREYGKKNSKRCLDSIERFFDDAEESNELVDGNEISHLAQWLRNERYNYIVRAIKECAKFQNNNLIVKRRIVVFPKIVSSIQNGTTGLGEFWSWGDNAEAHWHLDDGTNKVELTLTAEVSLNSVDWIATFRRNSNYLYGDDETEISLARGTPVILTSIKTDNSDEIEIHQSNQFC
jgi:hypothetical protein